MRLAVRPLRPVKTPHKPVKPACRRPVLVYIAAMSTSGEVPKPPRGLPRGLLLAALAVVLAGAAFAVLGKGGLSVESFIRHRVAIDDFVAAHRLLAVVAYIGLYIAAVALSVPGATFLTVAGGFLFSVLLGASAAVIGATLGATVIFLVARTALGEPLMRKAGPRATRLAEGFREDAFSYLLFLRLVPAFPFFLVNLVPAFAGVRAGTFIAATALGVIPGAVAFAFAGTGLDSVIDAQKNAYDACVAASRADCQLAFDAKDILTPQLIGALVALGALALVPVVVKRFRRT